MSKIWFFDIDDTLINTGEVTVAASEGIREAFLRYTTPEIADAITSEFQNCFALMLLHHQVHTEEGWAKIPEKKILVDALYSKLQAYQHNLLEAGHFKKFSREVFIKISCDMAGFAVTPAMIEEACTAYWHRLSDIVTIAPGAVALFDHLEATGQSVFLATGSDARLKLQDDGQFFYDGAYSGQFKRERSLLLRDRGLHFIDVCVADPLDKPSPEFFEKVVAMGRQYLGDAYNLGDSVFIGDSYKSDLEIPKQMGFGLVVLYREGQAGIQQEGEGYISVGDLSELINYIK